jgi:hypothetical protein
MMNQEEPALIEMPCVLEGKWQETRLERAREQVSSSSKIVVS